MGEGSTWGWEGVRVGGKMCFLRGENPHLRLCPYILRSQQCEKTRPRRRAAKLKLQRKKLKRLAVSNKEEVANKKHQSVMRKHSYQDFVFMNGDCQPQALTSDTGIGAYVSSTTLLLKIFSDHA